MWPTLFLQRFKLNISSISHQQVVAEHWDLPNTEIFYSKDVASACFLFLSVSSLLLYPKNLDKNTITKYYFANVTVLSWLFTCISKYCIDWKSANFEYNNATRCMKISTGKISHEAFLSCPFPSSLIPPSLPPGSKKTHTLQSWRKWVGQWWAPLSVNPIIILTIKALDFQSGSLTYIVNAVIAVPPAPQNNSKMCCWKISIKKLLNTAKVTE
jgi:hypothetical protein